MLRLEKYSENSTQFLLDAVQFLCRRYYVLTNFVSKLIILHGTRNEVFINDKFYVQRTSIAQGRREKSEVFEFIFSIDKILNEIKYIRVKYI